MRLRTRLKIPREHGAWGMLYVPALAGILTAGSFHVPVLLLVLSATLVFLGKEALIEWWRSRSWRRNDRGAGALAASYFGAGAAIGAPLLVTYRLYGLIPMAAGGMLLLAENARQAARRQERSAVSELLAIFGLTLTAPAAWYAARGAWSGTAMWLWAFCVLYFASSVFYVKLRVLSVHSKREEDRRRMRWVCGLYHAFLLAALAALALTGDASLFVLIAFTPVIARALWRVARPSAELNLRRIGLLEIAYSVVFLAFLTLSFAARA